LPDIPVWSNDNGENSPNGDRLNDRTESFHIINAGLLMKSFGDEASFISFSRAICLSFDTKDPFATHEIHVGFWWNKFPCAIVKESSEFGIHGSTPSWMFGGSGVGCWLYRGLIGGSKKCFWKRYLIMPGKKTLGLLILSLPRVCIGWATACVSSHGTCKELLVDIRGDVGVGGDDSLWGLDDEDEGVWDFGEAESVIGCCRYFGGDMCGESGRYLWDFDEAESVRECYKVCGGDICGKGGRYLWGDKCGDLVEDFVEVGGRG
jgi:hypothetical protein